MLPAGTHFPTLPNPRPVLLQKRMPWAALQDYLRTFSSLHTFNEHNPGDSIKRTGLERRPGGVAASTEANEGDVVERFWWKLKEEVARERGGSEDEGEEVGVEWPMTLMLCKRV